MIITKHFANETFVKDKAGEKKPDGNSWQIGDYDTANKWLTEGYNVSVCLQGSQLVCVDTDSEEANSLAKSYGLPTTYTEQTIRGYHYWYTLPDTVSQYKGTKVDGIELKCSSTSKVKVTVSPSQVHQTTYTVIDASDIAIAPQWVIQKVTERNNQTNNTDMFAVDFTSEKRELYSSEYDRELAEHLLNYIPNDTDRDTWIACIAAINTIYEGDNDGLNIVDTWSQGYVTYNPLEVERVYNSYTGSNQIGMGTLKHYAKEYQETEDDYIAVLKEFYTMKEKEDQEIKEEELKEQLTKGLKGFTSFAQMADMNIQDTEFIVDNLLPVGLTVLSGDAKIGKTMLALDIAIQVSNGLNNVLGSYSTKQGDVLYLDYENGLKRLYKRANDICQSLNTPLPDNCQILDTAKIDNSVWDIAEHRGTKAITRLQTILSAMPEVKLVVIDTLFGLLDNKTKLDDYAITSVLQPLERLAQEHNIAILVLHHNNKNGYHGKGSQHNILGSVGIQGSAGTMLILYHPDEDDKSKAAINVVSRDIERNEPVYLQWSNEGMRFTVDELGKLGLASKKPKYTDTEEVIISLICKYPDGIHYADIAKKLKKSQSNVSNYLRKLEHKDAITQITGKKGMYKALVSVKNGIEYDFITDEELEDLYED